MEAASKVPTPQPCVVLQGSFGQVQRAVLVVEKKLVAPFSPKDTPLVLISTFFAFNMHYTEGCTNYFTFFEVIFFKCKKPAKKTRLASLLARLT